MRSTTTSQDWREIVPRRRRTSRASIQYRRPIELRALLLAGIATSTNRRGESVSQKAMTGMFTYDASRIGWWSVRGSVRISKRGSMNFFWIWLVKQPGVKRPAMYWAPVYWAYLSTARWPYGRAEMTQTSAGFSMATMIRAASIIFSHVLDRSMTYTPSGRRLVGVFLHLEIHVLGSKVHLAGEHSTDILLSVGKID